MNFHNFGGMLISWIFLGGCLLTGLFLGVISIVNCLLWSFFKVNVKNNNEYFLGVC